MKSQKERNLWICMEELPEWDVDELSEQWKETRMVITALIAQDGLFSSLRRCSEWNIIKACQEGRYILIS